MYDTENVALRIKQRARELKIQIRTLMADCDLGINTVSQLANGRLISFVSLALIADQLDCSVDYLLGRTDNPEINK